MMTTKSRFPARLPTAFATVALALLVLSLFAACQKKEAPAPEGTDAAGEVSSDFRLASLEGKKIGPPDFKGQVVLVDFWATWCVPCHAQAEILKPLYQDLKDKGVQFLAVDMQEDEADVRKYVADNPFPYPVLLDIDGELSYKLGIYALPTLMVVDRKGSVTFMQQGVTGAKALRKVLEAAGAA